jgi:hypothetical protein
MQNLIYSDTSMNLLTPGSSSILARKFVIPYYRDSMNAIVQFRLYDKNNEFYTYNNDLVIPLYSARLYRPVNFKFTAIIHRSIQEITLPESPSSELKRTLLMHPCHRCRIPCASRLKLDDKYIPYFTNGISLIQ